MFLLALSLVRRAVCVCVASGGCLWVVCVGVVRVLLVFAFGGVRLSVGRKRGRPRTHFLCVGAGIRHASCSGGPACFILTTSLKRVQYHLYHYSVAILAQAEIVGPNSSNTNVYDRMCHFLTSQKLQTLRPVGVSPLRLLHS